MVEDCVVYTPSPMDTLPSPLYTSYTDDFRVYLSCSRTTLSRQWQNCFCLNQLTTAKLINWRQHHCRVLVATRGDCALCDIHKDIPNTHFSIDHKIKTLNDKLQERQIGGLRIHWLDESTWLEQFQAACPTHTHTHKLPNTTQTNNTSKRHSADTLVNKGRRRLFRISS